MGKGQKKQKKTPTTLAKLYEAAALDATVEEMCYFANISKDTYYRWIKEDKELSDEIDRLRESLVFKARTTVQAEIHKPETAKWYLERKRKGEFSTREEKVHDVGEDFKEYLSTAKEVLTDT